MGRERETPSWPEAVKCFITATMALPKSFYTSLAFNSSACRYLLGCCHVIGWLGLCALNKGNILPKYSRKLQVTVRSALNSHTCPVVDLVHGRMCVPPHGRPESNGGVFNLHVWQGSTISALQPKKVSLFENSKHVSVVLLQFECAQEKVRWPSRVCPNICTACAEAHAATVVRGERVDFIFSHITSVLPGQDSGSF